MEHKILIDDSGWGFPIGGVLCGAFNTNNCEFKVKEIPVKFFQEPLFSRKQYLNEFADKAVEIVREWGDNLPIEICTGYVLNEAYNRLKQEGYTIKRTKIEEPLQSLLESEHKEYIRKFGYDHYYDPKELDRREIGREFYKVIRWIKENKKEGIAKTGWRYFKYKYMKLGTTIF